MNFPTIRSGSSRAPTEVDLFVGERIRFFRLSADLTLEKLGEKLGISHQQLQKYESGANRITAGMLHQVSRTLNVPIPLFFEDEKTVSRDDVVIQFEHARRVIRQAREILGGACDE